jgi:hypothetical protein
MIHLLVQNRAVGDAPAGVVATPIPRLHGSSDQSRAANSYRPIPVVRIEGGRAVFGFRANHERKRPVFFFE